LDDIILTSNGVIREVNVHSAVIQTPGYIYTTKSKMGEIDGVKFVLALVSSYSNGVGNKPFFYSEGGSNISPVMIKSSTFTIVPGSIGSLTYNVLEITSGSITIIGCTFSDMKMNPTIMGDNAVMVVKGASLTLQNTVFSSIQLDTNAAILGSASSECEWGSYSMIILRDAITLIKETMISNTYAGVSVYGGTAVVEGTNFTSVGSQGNTKYPSVERHLRCGMSSYFNYKSNYGKKKCYIQFLC
jgi:hypothetical protein